MVVELSKFNPTILKTVVANLVKSIGFGEYFISNFGKGRFNQPRVVET